MTPVIVAIHDDFGVAKRVRTEQHNQPAEFREHISTT